MASTRTAAVYRIRNLNNDHFYIGSSVNVTARWRTHRRELRMGIHHCQPLQRAWVKHSEAAFAFEIVEKFLNSEGLIAAEDALLDEHHGSRKCYNVGRYAKAAFLGRTHTLEARAKLSAAHKGNRHRLGHTNSPEHRARQSAGMKGKRRTPEFCEAVRQRMLGKTYSKGRVMSEEQRLAMATPIVELTTGKEFPSIVDAADAFGLQRANLVRYLRTGGEIKRGPCKGLRFQRLAQHPPE